VKRRAIDSARRTWLAVASVSSLSTRNSPSSGCSAPRRSKPGAVTAAIARA
jgi:hypothetical protein